jgi:VanZ family protein
MAKRIPFLTIVVSALILVAVVLPGSALPDSPGIPGFDKMVHFAMFLSLAVAMHHDFQLAGKRRILAAVIAALVFSIFTEALQLMVDGRASELVDAIADMAGFSAGIIARQPLTVLLFRRYGS